MYSTLRHAFVSLSLWDAVSPPGFQSRRADGARMWMLSAYSREWGKGWWVSAREKERYGEKQGGKKSPTSSYRWLWIRQKRVECLTRTIHRWRVTVANDRQPFSFIPGDTSKLGVVRRRLPSREAAICCCKKAASRFYFGMLAHRPTHGFSNVAITASCKTATRAQLYGLITRNWN